MTQQGKDGDTINNLAFTKCNKKNYKSIKKLFTIVQNKEFNFVSDSENDNELDNKKDFRDSSTTHENDKDKIQLY